MTSIDANFLSTLHSGSVPDLPPAAPRRGLPFALPRLALGPVRKSIATASDDTDPSGSTLSTSANDNASDAAILRARGDAPAVVIGLALRHARFVTGDVPFAIVCALNRHASAGDGAARATLDMLQRRIERRQQDQRDRYVAIGLRRHPVLKVKVARPRLQVVRPDETGGAGR
ncbi:MAG: hypothetical protein ACT6QU_12875 [Aliihoeflea sp.]|uniref:hypothetical protein n=1 Tax=Aliihoeflea sp. TaxID=2608088 RepID=UPI004037DB93